MIAAPTATINPVESDRCAAAATVPDVMPKRSHNFRESQRKQQRQDRFSHAAKRAGSARARPIPGSAQRPAGARQRRT
jgi:hypothetical protein